VVGRSPNVEFLAQVRSDDGADEEVSGGHGNDNSELIFENIKSLVEFPQSQKRNAMLSF
jgi:hypothetical protein